MCTEHQIGRNYLKEMAEALELIKRNNTRGSEIFIVNAYEYIKLLREHIEKENEVLFRMADIFLSREKQKELFDGFEEIEEQRIGTGKHEEFHKMLHSLRDIYLK
jgi:hemerythrin-like domain-containing protein